MMWISKTRNSKVMLGIILIVVSLTANAQKTSSIVYMDNGKLVYPLFANEGKTNKDNRLPDWSYVGYMGGGVALPDVPVVKTISPSAGDGDDRALIQGAIDEVSALPLNQSNDTLSTQKDHPRVLIIGNSISGQYREYVVEDLKGKADVFWIKQNAGDTKRAIGNKPGASIEDWLAAAEGDWDIISFNYGLHDIKFANYKMTNKQVCSPQEYKLNLRYVIERLRKTGARLQWVNITPVRGSTEGNRIPGDEIVFNEAAIEVLREYPDILIVDLFISSMANLEQQDGVHFINKAGKQRAGNLVSSKIEILLDQIADDENAQQDEEVKYELKKNSNSFLQSKTEKIWKNGTWLDSWKYIYAYDVNGAKIEETDMYNKNGRWKNSRKSVLKYDKNGNIVEKIQQVWRKGEWENYEREEFSFTNDGKIAVRACQEWFYEEWLDTWKYTYSYDEENNIQNKESHVMVNGVWINILKRTFIYFDGRKTMETLSAKMGDKLAERYQYSYTYDSKGQTIKTVGERHYSDKWVKSSEYNYGFGNKKSKATETVLTGWFEGENKWEDIYKISRVYDSSGNEIRQQFKEKLVGLETDEVPLLDKSVKYDKHENLIEEVVSIAIKNNGLWKFHPSARRSFTYFSKNN